MKRINLNILITVIILTGVALLKGRFTAEEPSLKTSSGARTPSSKVMTAQSSPEIMSADIKSLSKKGAGAASSPSLDKSAVGHRQVFPFAKELTQYSFLKRKVFMTDEENGEWLALLKNPAVLRAMGQRLLQSAMDDAAALEQNAAVDMLLDALRSGNAPVATEVLKTVITDKQVEDVKLDIHARENLAGIKAEILYQWSALNPVQAPELAKWLPGPVSERIWKNVVTAQASNVAESADIDH